MLGYITANLSGRIICNFTCTAIGNLDRYLNQDCDIIVEDADFNVSYE